MARKRMFDIEVVDTDLFLDMPQSTQNLYFHLGMRADDDGFVSNPKKIIKLVGANDDDLKVLIAKKLIIPFESGVIVIRHWKLNNYLRKDRYIETIYKQEKSLLNEDENGVYELGIPDDNQTSTVGLPSKEKNSIEENSIEENRKGKKIKKEKKSTEFDELINSNFTDEDLKNTIYEFIKMRKAIKKPLTTRGLELMINKLYKLTTNIDEQIEILNNSIMNNWQGIFPLKQNIKVKNAMEEFLNG